METTLGEYKFVNSIIDGYDKYNGIIKSNKGCNHDRSKERELYERKTDDKLDAIKMFCEDGNKLFNENKIEEAIAEYKSAIIYIDYTFPDSNSPEEIEYNNLIIRTHSNLSACFLKLNEYNMTILHCKHVLKYDQNNLKAYYRLAKAYIGLYKYDEALSIINSIIHNDKYSENSDISIFNSLRNSVINLEKKYNKSNSKIYKKLFKN